MDKPQFIYALRDPRTKEIRYVGKSVDPRMRRKNHMLEGGFHNREKRAWAQGLRQENLLPIIEILEECTLQNWRNRETYWIDRLRAQGCPLLNLSAGGNGTGFYGGRKQSEETKAKLREANKQQFSDPEMRKRHSDGLRHWAAELDPEKKKNSLLGLEAGRKLGPQGMKRKWENMTPEQKAARVEKMHAWRKNLTPEEFSKIQRERCMKRYQK